MYISTQIPGEQVYLGCHMRGQGLLTDMISLARGKPPPPKKQSDLNSLIYLMFRTTSGHFQTKK